MSTERRKIVMLPGKMKVPDRVGHHDYVGGCGVLALLLGQTPGVDAVMVRDAWPANEGILDAARALVFYTGGGRKQFAAAAGSCVERIQSLVDRGIGMVAIHQAVRFGPDLAEAAKAWFGGVHVAGLSPRGHWASTHEAFPAHPVTRGVAPWEARDGWLNGIQFVDGMTGITPLVWSSRKQGGSPDGGSASVVAWAYERPDGGRSFCFTGLDAHGAWAHAGVRRLVVNGILWSAGLAVPAEGAPCVVDGATLRGYLTPRGSALDRLLALVGRAARRALGSRGSGGI